MCQRNWTVAAYTSNSITFTLFDKDGEQGFPGDVQSFVQYTLTPYTWHLKMGATALTKKTPIMLSSHVSAPTSSLATDSLHRDGTPNH